MLSVLLRLVGNNDKDYSYNYNYDLIITMTLIITKTMSMIQKATGYLRSSFTD